MRWAVGVAVLMLVSACGSSPRLSTHRASAEPVQTPSAPVGAEPEVRVSPIQPENRPTPVVGRENGRLDPSVDLIVVEGDCRAARPAAPSLSRMLAAARADGVTLTPGPDCYRPYVGQVSTSATSCAQGNCACAAKPGSSMHGWGKAVDFHEGTESITRWDDPAYLWLKANAARFGWNHGRWAEPGGSPCPEPWHWEWVGDGGRLSASPIRLDLVSLVSSPDGKGYAFVTALGDVQARGDGASYGTPSRPDRLVVGAASAPTRRGYWILTAGGAVYGFGDAPVLGSAPGQDVVGIASTPSGEGYWLAQADGRLLAFGDAPSLGPAKLAKPVVAVAAAGRGCWLLASDGEIAALGDARLVGAPPAVRAVSITATPTGRGYWVSTAEGAVLAFGDARFLGDMAPGQLRQPVVAITAMPSGSGYWLATADGGVFGFGDARFFGTA